MRLSHNLPTLLKDVDGFQIGYYGAVMNSLFSSLGELTYMFLVYTYPGLELLEIGPV